MDNKRKRYTPKIFSEKVIELIGILCSREGSEGGDATTSLNETLAKAPRGSLDQYGFLLQEGQPQPTDEILYVKQKLSGATMMPSLSFKYNNTEKEITGFLLYDHTQGKGRKVKIKYGGLNSSSLKINVGMGFFTSSYDITFIIFGKNKVYEDLSKISDEKEITNSTNIEKIVGMKQDENEEYIKALDKPGLVKNDEDNKNPSQYISEQVITDEREESTAGEGGSELNNSNVTYHQENSLITEEVASTPDDEEKQINTPVENPTLTAGDPETMTESTNILNGEDKHGSEPIEESTLIAEDKESNDEDVCLPIYVDKQVSTPAVESDLDTGGQENLTVVSSLVEDGNKPELPTVKDEPTLTSDDRGNTEPSARLSKDEAKQVSATIEEPTLTADDQVNTKLVASLPEDKEPTVKDDGDADADADADTDAVKTNLSTNKIDKLTSSNKNKQTFLNISYL